MKFRCENCRQLELEDVWVGKLYMQRTARCALELPTSSKHTRTGASGGSKLGTREATFLG
ncbi:hypothetical protein ACRRTK_016698 [Alexandromys fortis]